MFKSSWTNPLSSWTDCLSMQEAGKIVSSSQKVWLNRKQIEQAIIDLYKCSEACEQAFYVCKKHER